MGRMRLHRPSNGRVSDDLKHDPEPSAVHQNHLKQIVIHNSNCFLSETLNDFSFIIYQYLPRHESLPLTPPAHN